MTTSYKNTVRSMISHTKLLNWFFTAFAILFLSAFYGCHREHDSIEDNLPAIRIRVLNGSGFRGAASEYGNYLQRFNVDVIGIGNTEKFIYDKSIIVVKHQDEQDLVRLMKYTGITRRIYALSDHSVEQFQIIVGKDYRSYVKQ